MTRDRIDASPHGPDSRHAARPDEIESLIGSGGMGEVYVRRSELSGQCRCHPIRPRGAHGVRYGRRRNSGSLPGDSFCDPEGRFGNNFGAPSNHVLTTPDLVLYETISTFWRRFADTGDSNPRGVPEQWPPYQTLDSGVDPSRGNRHFVFAPRLGIVGDLRDAPCNFWESFSFRSALGAVPASAR